MEKTETEPMLVPIISREVRNVWLPFYDHGENRSESRAAAQRQMVILPGLNWKPADQIRKCGPLRAKSLKRETCAPRTRRSSIPIRSWS